MSEITTRSSKGSPLTHDEVDANFNNLNTFTQSGTGAVARQVTDKLKDVVSVKDFGAIGDGTTDDTAAIQAAIDSGKSALFPKGVYVTKTINGKNNCALICHDVVTLKRISSASGNTPILSFANKSNFQIKGPFVFDGNKTSQTQSANNIEIVSCNDYLIDSVSSINAKASGMSYGSGIVVAAGTNQSTKKKGVIQNCICANNEGSGIFINKDYFVDILNNVCDSNLLDGLQVANLVYPPVADVVQMMRVHGNRFLGNGINGFNFIGFYIDSISTFGWQVPAQRYVEISGNIAYNNTAYGGVWQGNQGFIANNMLINNGATGGVGGGMVANCSYSIVSNNSFYGNNNYQLDTGGGYSIVIASNLFDSGGKKNATPTIDINVGGTQNCAVLNNHITNKENLACEAIKAIAIEGTTQSNPFNQFGINLAIRGNKIDYNTNSSSIGIFLSGGYRQAVVESNSVYGMQNGFEYLLEIEGLRESNNIVAGTFGNQRSLQPLTSATTLIIPDVGEKFRITSNTDIQNIRTLSANSYYQKVRSVVISNQGSGYSQASPPSVSFSGGGGAGAAGIAQVSIDGKVVGVVMTNYGSGYTSTPSVSINGGGGSGATAIAEIGCNNSDGRKIVLFFEQSLALKTGGNIGIASDLSVSANTPLQLFSAYGNWYRAL